MKDFMKYTFASMVGVVLACVVLTILGLVTMVGMVASSDTETSVEENSILMLELEGTLAERTEENPLEKLLGEENRTLGLDDILTAISKAKDN